MQMKMQNNKNTNKYTQKSNKHTIFFLITNTHKNQTKIIRRIENQNQNKFPGNGAKNLFVDGNSIGLENRRTNLEIKITASARCTNVARGEYGSIRRELMILKFYSIKLYRSRE